MRNILQLISGNSSVMIAANMAALTFVFILLLVLLLKQVRLKRKYNMLARGMDNKNLEEILMAHLNRVDQVVDQVHEIAASCTQLKKITEKTIQKIGVVRFNAFSDTGSDLSFALAFLDNLGDGVVISSIFGRDDQRTYAKPVSKGSSQYHLSKEEEKAIQLALQQK